MLFIELFLSDMTQNKQKMEEVTISIHKFFMDTFPDMEHTKNIFVIFPECYVTLVHFESREKYTKGNESHKKRNLVRISGVPDFNKMIYREFVKAAVSGDFKKSLESHIQGILQKKDDTQEYHFCYI
jgi:hypothetical protein